MPQAARPSRLPRLGGLQAEPWALPGSRGLGCEMEADFDSAMTRHGNISSHRLGWSGSPWKCWNPRVTEPLG